MRRLVKPPRIGRQAVALLLVALGAAIIVAGIALIDTRVAVIVGGVAVLAFGAFAIDVEEHR